MRHNDASRGAYELGETVDTSLVLTEEDEGDEQASPQHRQPTDDVDDPSSRPSTSNGTKREKRRVQRKGTLSKDKHLTPLEVEMMPLTDDEMDDDFIDNDDHDNSNRVEQMLYPVKLDGTEYTGWKKSLHEWLFPPHIPRSCQLLRKENIAVPACYLLVGILQGLSGPLINVLPLDLGATAAQQTTISGIRSLPASFKLFFGFLSDNLPMCGYRRKPYMLMGWLMASLSLLTLLMGSNLRVPSRHAGCFHTSSTDTSTVDDENRIPDDAPSIGFLSVALLGFGTGFWLADVMGDSIVAEKAKLEPPEARGSVQSCTYTLCNYWIVILVKTRLAHTDRPLEYPFHFSLLLLSFLRSYDVCTTFHVHVRNNRSPICDLGIGSLTTDHPSTRLDAVRSQRRTCRQYKGTVRGNLENSLLSSSMAANGFCILV